MSTDRTTEILNYLSAISRDVGELRTGLNSLRTEVSELRTEMNTRFAEVNTRFAEVNTRFAEVNTHLSEQSARLDRIERDQRLQGRTLGRVEGMAKTTRADVEELQDRVDTLEGK
jgi:chromosome segregation ATPase